jgi:hypothetical protein
VDGAEWLNGLLERYRVAFAPLGRHG